MSERYLVLEIDVSENFFACQAARSATLVMNLVVLVVFLLTAYFALGGELFEADSLDRRANYESFIVGFMTLFQSKTILETHARELSALFLMDLQCAVALTWTINVQS